MNGVASRAEPRFSDGPPAPVRRTSWALVDCNNFYCSCESAFDPSLATVPLVVLSNNDGCAIARCPRAKALGVKMGTPMFQLRDLVRERGLVARSSNYTLYGSMSARVVAILEDFAVSVEPYSIDETFVDVGPQPLDRIALGAAIRSRVRRWTGIPTCVGFGPTKALAKTANRMAKKLATTGGVVDLTDPDYRRTMLDGWPLDDVWGVGDALTARLRSVGVETAGDLARLPRARARAIGTVVLERLVMELCGEPTVGIDGPGDRRRSVAVTRSFGARVTDPHSMLQALATFSSRACGKLRALGLEAGVAHVFFSTGRHDAGPAHSVARTWTAPVRTADARVLSRVASRVVDGEFRHGIPYARAGVVLEDLGPAGEAPGLFGLDDEDARDGVMDLVDAVDGRWGRGTLRLGAEGFHHPWRTRHEHLSPRYTTRWSDLPTVSADPVRGRDRDAV